MMSPTTGNGRTESKEDTLESIMHSRESILQQTLQQPLRPFQELLVTMCGALKHEDRARVGPFLWANRLKIDDRKAVISVRINICVQKGAWLIST